jgi:hypothetical protein
MAIRSARQNRRSVFARRRFYIFSIATDLVNHAVSCAYPTGQFIITNALDRQFRPSRGTELHH